MKLRGYLAVAVGCFGFLVADLVQRFVIGPWIWIRPSRRTAILSGWIQALAWMCTRPIATIGGAHIPVPPQVPFEPGVLIVMNHQSLFDIPMVVESARPGHPRILTRKRYTRWIPLISHMLRLYQYPIVDPRGNPSEIRASLDEIRRAARTSEVPLALFPEGTRTKDGEIGRFRKNGLKAILQARPWNVYVLVVDGFWRVAKFKDFIEGISKLRGRLELAGILEWTDPEADPDPFIDEIRATMVRGLVEIREGASVA